MSNKASILFLSQEDVIAAGGLDMKATIECLEKAFRLEEEGECLEPEPPMLLFGDQAGPRFTMHPAYLGGDVRVAGIKWTGSNPENPRKRGLPRALSVFILSDRETCYPLAVLENSIISGMRTGAVAGLGAKYLARPDSETAGILGAGVIGRYELMAFQSVLPGLRRAKVFDIVPGKAETWAAAMEERLGLEVRAAGSARETVEGSDVVGGATMVSLKDRYVQPEWFKEGGLYCNISDNDPTFEFVLSCDKIVVDGYRQFRIPVVMGEMVRLGLLKEDQVHATLAQLVTGKRPGRESEGEKILMSALGLGMEDLINVKRVYDQAKRLGLGRELTLWEEPLFV